MDNQIELLPCPFCGGEGEVFNNSITDMWCWQVRCLNGCLKMPWEPHIYYTSEETATEAWNRRIPDYQTRMELAGARAEIKRLIKILEEANNE